MSDYMKENECFQKDYDTLYAKGAWDKDALERMKNYKKLIYYNLVIDAMENGKDYPGSEHMPEMSFRRGRNPMNGQYMSRDMRGMNGGSGMYYPQYMDGNSWDGRSYGMYDDMNMSGRRYYDSEKEKAIHQVHKMLDNTDDPERKSALNFLLNMAKER